MSSTSTQGLEKLLQDNDLGWVIDWFVPPGRGIQSLLRLLADATKESQKRFGPRAPQFTEESLLKEFQQNPHKVRAFLQALAATRQPHMLVMVWRILQGMRIQQIDMEYRERFGFRLRCLLNSPYEGEDQPDEYMSTDIADAMLLRHLGIMEMDKGPVFEGFYPLRVQ
jgi:hypothetical protein